MLGRVDLPQRRLVGDRRRHGRFERVEQREVPVAVERREQRAPAPSRRSALERPQELPAGGRVLAERLDLAAQVLEQDVEVADGPERAARASRARRAAAPPRPDRAGRCPARRKARSRRVATRSWCSSSASVPSRVPGSCRKICSPCSRRRAASVPGDASAAGSGALRVEVQVERLEDLRPAFAVVRPGSAQRLLDPAQRALVAVEQLDLELVEAAGDALVVEDRDRVVDDLGAVGADALAARAQARDRRQRRASQVRHEERDELGRWRQRPAGFLQLEPRRPGRQLQLPEPFSVLDPMAKRDPAPGEPVVGGVVVGRDEEPRLDRLAAELGQREVLAGTKLHFPLERLADRHPPSLGRGVVKRR